MKNALKIGGSLVASILVLALVTLRLMGLEPGYLDPSSEEFARSNRIARPGLRLTRLRGVQLASDRARAACKRARGAAVQA